MGIILEFNVRAFEFAAPLDVDHARSGDQDIGNGFVAQQRLQRTQAKHFVQDFFDETVLFDQAQRRFLLVDKFGDGGAHLLPHPFAGHSVDGFQVDAVQQFAMNGEF